eukprot:3332735-Heterocapsa_arctica.AAC.1
MNWNILCRGPGRTLNISTFTSSWQRSCRRACRRTRTTLRCVRGTRIARTRHAGTKKADSSLRCVGNQASRRFFGFQELDARIVVGALDVLDRR